MSYGWMVTGCEQLDDEVFWAEVGRLLDALVRHGGGTRASQVTGLADYVRAEAERRDSQLAANTARTVELAKTAWEREDSGLVTQFAGDVPFTPAETAELDQMGAAYRARFAELAGAGT